MNPDEPAPVHVQLISPEAYPCCLWEGRVLSILEGTRLVGTLTVRKIINKSLDVLQENYKSRWEEPAHLDKN